MAYDWGQGLEGAIGGATAGSMVAGPWGALGGGVLGLLGGFTSDATTEQLNPYTAQYWDILNQNMTNYNRQMTGAMGQQDTALGQAGNYYGQLANFTPSARFDPAAATRMTIGQNPMLQNMARESLGDFTDAESMQRSIQQAATGAAANFNNINALGSGAAARSIGEAAGDVAGRYNMAQSQAYQNAYLQLLQNQQRMNMAGVEGQYNAAAARDQMQFQGIAGAAGGYGNIASQYGNRANTFRGLMGQTTGAMASMAGPEYIYTLPQQVFDAGGTMMGIAGLDAAMRGPRGEGQGLFDRMFGGGGGSGGGNTAPSPRIAPTPPSAEQQWSNAQFLAPSYDPNASLHTMYNPMYNYQPGPFQADWRQPQNTGWNNQAFIPTW